MKKTLYSIRMRASENGLHISGAEGIYGMDEINEAVRGYASRALGHPKGRPDSIVITVDRLKERPKPITALDICTVPCDSPLKAKRLAEKLLVHAGVSVTAVRNSFRILGKGMSGAAIISAKTGLRLDKEGPKGVRVSHIGIDNSAIAEFNRRLSRRGLNTQTIREAVILASKVSLAPGIAAELCMSDDPDYTTGYVASKKFGYVRVPNMKKLGRPIGGRVFFTKFKTGLNSLISYLKQKPVMVSKAPNVSGKKTLDEIINNPDS